MTRKYLLRETSFVDTAFEVVRSHFAESHASSFFRSELGVGRSIADIVGLVSKRKRLAIPSEPYNVVESGVVACLRNCGGTRIDLLERACRVAAGEFRTGKLNRLREWGVVEESKGGRISLSKRWAVPYSIMAIEAKLARWRDALTQAIEYKKYATQSFVLLPFEFARAAIAAKHEFDDNEIGLLVYDHPSLSCEIEAPRIDDHGWRRDFVYSRLVSE